jgi:hypothetical protein
MLPFCAEDGVGVIPYNPIAGGLLSGKHNRGSAPPDGSRFTLGTAGSLYQDRYWHQRQFDTVEALRKLADQAGVPLVTLSVAWVLANPAVTAPIIGASRPEQLDASLAAAGYALAPPHPVNASGFLMADNAVWIEHAAGGFTYTDEETVSALAVRFDTIRSESYRASESAALIERLAGTWAAGGNPLTQTPTAATA